MQTSPFFASQPRTPFPVPSLVGGPSLAAAAQAAHAVLPRGAEAPPEFEVPQLDTSLYHRTVFTMPVSGNHEHAEITIYFDKATLQTVYICNWQAFSVLCDKDADTVQKRLGIFLLRNPEFKKVYNS